MKKTKTIKNNNNNNNNENQHKTIRTIISDIHKKERPT